METNVFTIKDIYFNSKTWTVKLDAFDNIYTDQYGEMQYTAIYDGNENKITFTFDQSNEIIQYKEVLGFSVSTTCLLLCGLGLIGPMLDCFRKNKHSWKDFLKCLEDQEGTLVGTVTTCIAACYNA